MMTSLLLFTAPLLLLIIIGILIRARSSPETSGRRYFLFLIWTSLGLLTLIILNWIIPLRRLNFALVFFPIIPGLIVLTLLHGNEWSTLNKRMKGLVLFVAGILLAVTVGQLRMVSLQREARQLEPIFFGLTLFSVSVFMLIVWKLGKRYVLLLCVITVLYLTFFLVFDLGGMSLPSETMPGWVNALGAFAYLAIPGMSISVMAKLIGDILNTSQTTGESKSIVWTPIVGRSMLFIVLLGYLVYTYRWLSLWDGSDDGIRGLFMVVLSGITAVSAAMVIAMTTSGGRRWVGLLFVVLVMGPIYLAALTSLGMRNGLTNYTITEQRAAQIQHAIESHRAATGSYPSSLQDLIPSQMWHIPLPMIVPGQGWCYQGGSDYYRLATVYREHWSSPYFSVRVYASAGNMPEGTWECDAKLADAIAQSGYFDSQPTPVPLPTAPVSVRKVIVEPVVQAESFSVAGWSPDGAYLAFELNELSMTDMEKMAVDLRFLDAKTGALCQPDESRRTVANSYSLSEHSAWLPDGRFLYLTDDGTALAYTPCAAGADDLTDRFLIKLVQVMSADASSGYILLRNEQAYWLLDGNTFGMSKIEGVPTESYRPMYAWSPGGERLAISLMSGPQPEDEASLYLVDPSSAEVTMSLPLEGASDANLPFVEWLTRDELLLHGDTLTVLDFTSNPPTKTDVLKDIFLLDVTRNEISSIDSVRTDTGYYLGIQVNHPRNQDGYLYASETQQVEVFQQDVSTIIFMGDGQWLRLIKWEDQPSYRDEYVLVWMDGSHAETRLKIQGHVPRAHPQIFPGFLPDSSQLYFSSSQGISLVSLPAGETVGFWDLSSDADYFSVTASPNGEALIVESSGDGLYYIPLP